MKNSKAFWVLIVAAIFFAEARAADLDAAQQCVGIDNANSRLACYDAALGRDIDPVEAPVEVVAETPPPPPPAEPTLDDLDKREREKLEIAARVNRCERGSGRKYVFYFEGGQVWKQVSDKRLFFKACDFDVTVTKDMFGYKMQIAGERSKIRISRLR